MYYIPLRGQVERYLYHSSSLINMFLLKTIFKLTSLSSFLYARWIQNEKWKWKFLFDKRNMNHSLSTNRYSETRRKVEDLESSDNFRYWSSRIIHTAPRRYCWFHLISPRIESFGLMKFSIELRRPPFGGFEILRKPRKIHPQREMIIKCRV